MVNLLIENINEVVKKKIKIDFNTNFRNAILFEILMQDNKLSKELKLMQARNLVYPQQEQITDIKTALEDIIWFYQCGREEKMTSQKNIEESKKQIYSYVFDDELIYCAFKNQYSIDLQDISYLHWWKFKALFNGLKDDNQIVKVMGYRAIDLSKIKDKEEKKKYRRLQQIYALPDMRTEAQKESDFANAFW